MTGLRRLTRTEHAPKVGIVHLGPGAFFRAFLAPYTQDAMGLAAGDWGILAVSLRSTAIRDSMRPQGCIYQSVTLEAGQMVPQMIEAVADVWVAPENPGDVIQAMADPNVRIVSLTITEKGYCYSAETGGLDLEHPDIKHARDRVR